RCGEEVLAVEADRPGGGKEHAAEDAQRGGLPGAVQAQEAHHLTGLDAEREVPDGRPCSVVLGELLDLDHPRGRTLSQAPRGRSSAEVAGRAREADLSEAEAQRILEA